MGTVRLSGTAGSGRRRLTFTYIMEEYELKDNIYEEPDEKDLYLDELFEKKGHDR